MARTSSNEKREDDAQKHNRPKSNWIKTAFHVWSWLVPGRNCNADKMFRAKWRPDFDPADWRRNVVSAFQQRHINDQGSGIAGAFIGQIINVNGNDNVMG